jgi:hypothetical protein
VKEGWAGNDYLILFFGAERGDWTSNYSVAKRLPGFELIGICGWDDLIVAGPNGVLYRVPAVPMRVDKIQLYEFPDEFVLRPEPELVGKIPWRIKPMAFDGDIYDKENVALVSLEEHAQLVSWWNDQIGVGGELASTEFGGLKGGHWTTADSPKLATPFHELGIVCCVGFLIGALAGMPLFWFGRMNQALGISLIGGMIGAALAYAKWAYDLNLVRTFGNAIAGMIVAKIPGGAILFHYEPKPAARLKKRSVAQASQPKLRRRLLIGAILGVLLLFPPVLVMMIYAPDQWFKVRRPEEIPLTRVVLVIFIPGFVGSLLGASIGGLTVRGVHRRNILVGKAIGAGLGAGVAIAIAPNAAISLTQLIVGTVAVFSWFGALCGLLAPENFGVSEETEDQR